MVANRQMLASNWSHYIEEIVSPRISHFYFFDGELIDNYTSTEGAKNLISNGIYCLLGLDAVNRLLDDFEVINKRKKKKVLSKDDKTLLDEKTTALQEIQDELSKLKMDRESLRTQRIESLNRELDELNLEYEQYGGDIIEKKSEIESSLISAQNSLQIVEACQIELVSGLLPLTLVHTLLADLSRHSKVVEENRFSSKVCKLLEDRDTDLLENVSKNFKSKKLKKFLEEYLKSDLDKRLLPEANIDYEDNGELGLINSDELIAQSEKCRTDAESLLKQLQKAKEYVEGLEQTLSSIPPEDSITNLQYRKKQLESELDDLLIEESQLSKKIDNLIQVEHEIKNDIESILIQKIKTEFESKNDVQFSQRIDSAKAVLDKFRGKILVNGIERIEALIFDSLQTLMHKDSSIRGIEINSDNFNIALIKFDGKVLEIGQLSTGEKHLLAISLLWGLARASGKPFPVVMDTPLGRLDSCHRMRLSKHYFGQASHQVILFSTDEEIVNDNFKSLKSYISRTYKLNYNSKSNSTIVENGESYL